MDQVDLTQPAFVFWMRASKFKPGRITRFDQLEKAVQCVMQHALARTASVAWIKTMNQHLDMQDIRRIARQASLLGFLSNTDAARQADRKSPSLMRRLAQARLQEPG
jgi:hypothetical protein